MKHGKYWQYQETLGSPWRTITAEELLFVLLPEGKVVAYRCEIDIHEEEPEQNERTGKN